MAVATFPRAMLEPVWPGVEFDEDSAACLRSVLLKPEHEAWLDRIWDVLVRAAGDTEESA